MNAKTKTTQIADSTHMVQIQVQYGMGAACQAILQDTEIKEMTVYDAIFAVINSPQPTVPALRTARTIADVVAGGRQIDLEISGSDIQGKPIELCDKLDQQTPDIKNLTIKISEPFVGGRKNG